MMKGPKVRRDPPQAGIVRCPDCGTDRNADGEPCPMCVKSTVFPCEQPDRTFDTGAVRSGDADGERYDLISPIGLRRIAARYALGAEKYTAHNWERGFPWSTTLNHLLRHVVLWMGGDRSEDHLAAVAWGALALMHFEETRAELNDIPARGGVAK